MADVDLTGLYAILAEREYAGLPFRVVPLDAEVAPLDILRDVQAAVGYACVAAEERNLDDPTNAWDGDPTPEGIVSEVNHGTMTDEEIAAFFRDLAVALDARGLAVRVVPHRPSPRMPNYDSFRELPRTPTAYLRFTWEILPTGPMTNPDIVIPAPTLAAIAEPIVAWTCFPGAAAIAQRGITRYAATLPQAIAELARDEPYDQMTSVTMVRLDPPTLRGFEIHPFAKATLQTVDPTRSSLEHYHDVLDGLRILAPYLAHGYLRLGLPGGPDEVDFPLGHKASPWDYRAWDSADLLPDRVPDAHVAQIVTTRQLSHAGTLDGFHLEPLGHDRHLLAAEDPEPWLTGIRPDPHLQDPARAAFGDMLLTPEHRAATPHNRFIPYVDL